MAWHDVYLSLGSNSSDQEQKMTGALNMIKSIPGIRIAAVSRTRSYPAVGSGYDGIFLNNAVHIRSYLSPDTLHAAFRRIEAALGRCRETEAGTRPIDIDILLYDDYISSGGDYVLPYPELDSRIYVPGAYVRYSSESTTPDSVQDHDRTIGKSIGSLSNCLAHFLWLKESCKASLIE